MAHAFRDGTALHKLYLSPAVRYSEDIDPVQVEPGPTRYWSACAACSIPGLAKAHGGFALTGFVVDQTLMSASITSNGAAPVTGSLIMDGATTIHEALSVGAILTSKTWFRVGAALTVDGDVSLGCSARRL